MLVCLALTGCTAQPSPAPTLTLPPQPNPLDGTDWKLLQIEGQPVLADSPIYLHFWQAKLTGEMSCNNYQAEYRVEGQQIRLEMISVTVQLCPQADQMEQEDRYTAVWKEYALEQRSMRFQIHQENGEETLTFLDAAGNPLLLFENAVRDR